MRRERRQLTKAELRAMGCAPGLMVVRYRPDGERAEVQEVTPEAKKFAHKAYSADRQTEERERV